MHELTARLVCSLSRQGAVAIDSACVMCSQDLGKGQDLQWAQAEQMHALAQTLFEHLRFRHDPYEWVYQGFAPLLLPDVVTNKCAPATPVCMYVCRRLILGRIRKDIDTQGH